MKLLLTFCLFCIATLFTVCFGQRIETIIGTVVDEQGEILIGNIEVLDPVDSTFITGTSYLYESFKIENIQRSEILLKFTSILFPDTILTVTYTDASIINLGKMVIRKKSHELEEVTIKGRRPRIKQLTDGTIEVTIENTSLESSSSIEEVLSRSPGIIINEDGYSVIGKETAIFYINGKRVTQDQINLIHPSNIKKVEIIRNPSAKYDADGGAVIHIRTLSIHSDGYQIKLQQNLSHSSFFGFNGRSSANINYAKKALKLKGSYSLYGGDYKSNLHTTRDRDREEIFLRTDLNTEWDWYYKPSSLYSLGLQYDLDPNNYISVEYSGMLEKNQNFQSSQNIISNSSTTNFYSSEIDDSRKNIQNSISVNYSKAIDTLGSSLFIGGQYSDLEFNRDNIIDEKSTENEIISSRYLEGVYDQSIALYSAQLDYTKFLDKTNSIDLGVKYSDVRNDALQNFFTSDEGTDFILDPRLSNIFNYKEQITSAYLSYNNKISDGINIKAGLRNEFTRYAARFSTEINDKLTNHFYYLFPSLSVQIKMSNSSILNIALHSSIRRPPYHHLSPITIYQDPYTSIRGNPNLIAQKTYSLSANTTLWKTSVEAGYNYTKDPLDAGALRGDDEFSYILQNLNYDFKHAVYTTLSRSLNFKGLTSNNTASLSYTNVIENDLDVERQIPAPSIYLRSNNIVDIGSVCKLEILCWYAGVKNSGIFRERERSSINLTIEKKFLNNALTMRLQSNDIFHNAGPAGTYNIGETDIFYEREFSTQFYRLSIAYNLGSLKKVSYKNKSTGSSEINRAN